MSMILTPQMAGAMGAYGIKYAALFDGATGYLSRTASAAPTSATKATVSVWVMKNDPLAPTNQRLWCTGTPDSVGWVAAEDRIFAEHQTGTHALLKSTAAQRDPLAMFHVVWAYDSTLATPSERVKLYVNNVLQTWASGAYPDLNSSLKWLAQGVVNTIGNYDAPTGQWFDGYMAEFCAIDGQAQMPSAFGEVDSVTKNWKARKYTGTYGANGFHLDFADAANLGKDVSGNGNHWAKSGTLTQVTSTPTKVMDRLNPLANAPLSGITFSNGNRTVSASTVRQHILGTLAMKTGKYRWTVQTDAARTAYATMGVAVSGKTISSTPSYAAPAYVWGYSDGGGKCASGTVTTGYVSNINRWEFEFDATAGTLLCSTSDSDQFTIAGLTDPAGYLIYVGVETPVVATVHIAEANWTYPGTVGFKENCTDNLPKVTDWIGNHFTTKLYTGNGATQGVAGVGFQPDFVWIKQRNGAWGHTLYDSLRGATKYLGTENTGAETTDASTLTSFDADGFSLGGAGWVNGSGNTFAAWCAKLPNSETNANGTINVNWKYNATSGVMIGAYVGNGAAGATLGIPSAMGALGAPKAAIVKCRNTAGYSWPVYHASYGNAGGGYLNSSAAFGAGSTLWNNTSPTSGLFTLGNSVQVNENTKTYVIILFFQTPFCRIGSYTGTGNADGPCINEMLSPVWTLWRGTDGNAWAVIDSARDNRNPAATALRPDAGDPESTAIGGEDSDFLVIGRKVRSANSVINTAGVQYIYVTIGQPMGPSENTAR